MTDAFWGRLACACYFAFLCSSPIEAFSEDLSPIPERIIQIGFVSAGNQYHIEVVTGKDAAVTEGHLNCANPSKSPELRGLFTLILRKDEKKPSNADMDAIHFVYNEGNWQIVEASEFSEYHITI